MEERDVGGVRCSRVLEQLSDYLGGELDTSEVARVEAHLSGCPNCTRFGKGFSGVLEALNKTKLELTESSSDFLRRFGQAWAMREANENSDGS